MIGTSAFAQTSPGAGQILREVTPPAPGLKPAPEPKLPEATPSRPATPGAPGITFVLRDVQFKGNTVFSAEALRALAADTIGQSTGLADLEAIAMRVTDHYQRAGYFLAQAIVPAQNVASGVVEISIVEGRLGRLRIEQAPDVPIPETFVERASAPLKRGAPLRLPELERVMLLLSDVPGIRVESALEQGEEPGTTDLLIAVTPSRRWDLSVDADNHGSRSVGEYRVGVLGRIRSPLKRGDNLDMRLVQSTNGDLTFARVAYETPVDAQGTRVTAGLSRVRYALGGDFASLDGSGTATVIDLAAAHPLIRSRHRNLVVHGGVAEKHLDDELRAVGMGTEKRIRAVSGGINYEARDGLAGGGYSSAAITAHVGKLDIRTPAAREADQAPGGSNTDGAFGKLNVQLSRLQSVFPALTAYAGLAGQFASGNLDSAEKLALGGPSAVRAYSSAEAIVDEGVIANAELRYSVHPSTTVSAFYDWARGDVLADPVGGTDNVRVLRGYGLGLYWSGYGFTVKTSLAWRGSEIPRADSRDPKPRLFAQVVKVF